ncbi:hypothetical protein HMPREF1143_0485 [Peptoanaerobacter stomatis]|uniref:PF10934 family protein n=1 Tax=Peptoanaerobacter stomatis TaxID=796937 RepID=J6HCX8_9FIRM|nr:hypothetical protein [Peptoanaerobacter stomatis]EJU22955.1 hypothetical protein HMPREF1143_0485 [Peptoanaerobacter stomatis]
MKTFLIKDDDIVIENGDVMLVYDTDEICQCVERAITTRLEEFFLSLEHGMDYEEMQSKAPDIDRLKLDVIEAALQEERLSLIESIYIDINRANRKANIMFVGILENGEEIQGEVVI